ncbi:hypothetical protein [Helicobacter anatolicus]|uniref:hypothetical protein n=1 Tax=Helicobacter anatolicus TaxID=2905874 RepID=UPI001E3902B4|nr:hypothetical protein [Helicobacter anatolicus]MCE3038548.1 hypothetical protein [Helicobacter anatolicus]
METQAVFVAYCVIGVILLVVSARLYYKKTQKDNEMLESGELNCNLIFKKLKSSQCAREDLYYYIDYFFKNYHTLKPSIKQSKDLLKIVCLHKHTNAQIILKTQKLLIDLNPNIKYQLNKIVEIRAGIC